ncbi:MAG: type II secretion system protein E, partial [Oscillospiraceae bacterium]
YRRMVSLCKRAVDMSDQTLLEYVQEAYPLAVYCKKLDNRERRITGIAECIIHPDGSREYSTLYQYVIDDNIVNDDGSIVITGHHEVVNEPSISLQKRLIENGMPFKMLARFLFAAEDAG